MQHVKALGIATLKATYMALHTTSVFMYESGKAAREYWEDADGSALVQAAVLELWQAALLAYRRRTQRALPPASVGPACDLPDPAAPSSPLVLKNWLHVDTLHAETIMSAKCKELQGWCRDRGLPTSGKVAELRTRLLGN